MRLNGTLSHKAVIFKLAAVRISNLTYEVMIRYAAPTRHCKGNEVQQESRPTSAVYKLKKAYGSGDEYSKAK
jgi:hypothetical protein